MEILIVGGGVCGLALAHGLAPAHDVTVLEASPGPRGGGYMIDFFGPGVAAAGRLGVLGEMRARSRVFEGVRYVDAADREHGRIEVAPLIDALGSDYFSILRPQVELALLAALPDAVDLRYSARVREVHPGARPGERPRAVLESGEELIADLVVGCDGVRSRVRAAISPAHADVVPMGYRASSFLFEDPQIAAELGDWAMLTDSLERTAGLYACDDRSAALLLMERVDPAATARPTPDADELRARFSGLHPLADRALEHAPAQYYDDLVAQSSAPAWSRGGVTLAGDAAHAVSLLAGQGTSLAIAGAEALAVSLRHAGPHRDAGLAEYERRMRPVAERAQRSGRRSAGTFISRSPAERLVHRAGRRLLSAGPLTRLIARRLVV
ncbi:FAD-dependent monooxygenase [Brachybacterium kimchii]|uniref:FAD-dependent monooxygenase n=1 Tax=Brachybacterium kimchii TaxID=2942909 RepID=A0ABY4N2F2_9MICO|nr:FAD-dependent monooxygenase [Brachybacterium kimchii]UQN28314.1 FAD-dependent monooxygenase [Brachybacterium kimchii]